MPRARLETVVKWGLQVTWEDQESQGEMAHRDLKEKQATMDLL